MPTASIPVAMPISILMSITIPLPTPISISTPICILIPISISIFIPMTPNEYKKHKVGQVVRANHLSQ